MPIVPYVPKANIDAAQFGVRAGSGIDNADALERLQNYLKASSIRHEVTFPTGLIQSSYNWWLSNLGSKGPIIKAYDTQFQSSTDSSYSFFRFPLQIWPWHYVNVTRSFVEGDSVEGLGTDNQNYGYKIDTANAGDKTVTVQAEGDADNFSAGDIVCIHGLDQQGNGTPRNLKFFEYRKVASIAGADITLTEPLRHTYHQSWPDVSYQSPAMSTGAPRIAPTSHANNDTTRQVEIHGAEFLGWSESPDDHKQLAPYVLEHLKLVRCKMDNLYLSLGRLNEIERCEVKSLEIDKIIEKVVSRETIYGGDATDLPIGGGTGLRELEIHGGRINGAASSLTAQSILLNGVGGGPDPGDAAFINLSTIYAIRSLRVQGCDFHNNSTNDLELIGLGSATTTRTFTSSATSANHGAGQFAVADNNYNALTGLIIGCPVWEEEGDAVGRVVAFTHDAANSEYIVTVDSTDTFTAESTLCVSPVNNVHATDNNTSDPRVAIVSLPNRDVAEQAFVLRLNERQISADRLNYNTRFPIGGEVTKVRCTVSRATSTGGKDIHLCFQHDSDLTFEGGRIKFALDQVGTREYSATSNTLHADDSIVTAPVIGFASYVQFLNGLSTVDTDDLPKYTLEIFVNYPAEVGDNGETVTAASPTLGTKQASKLDSSSNAINATLGSGDYVGQIKTIVMTNASNSSTVSVTNHETSDPEVFTFDAVDECLVLIWMGTEWATLKATATT